MTTQPPRRTTAPLATTIGAALLVLLALPFTAVLLGLSWRLFALTAGLE